MVHIETITPFMFTVKLRKKATHKKTKKAVSKTNYGLMQVKSIAEYSLWNILQYFDLH